MKIIANEKEYAEYCIENKILGTKPYFDLSILAKYYYHYCGYRKKKIIELLIDFLEKYYPRYEADKLRWSETCEQIAKRAGKYPLYEIDGISITKTEMERIKDIHNRVLERLAFTSLCIAKLNVAKNNKNNYWVSTSDKELFKLAHISCSTLERNKKLGRLRELGLVEFPKRNENMSFRVTFADDGEEELFISDFRELGFQYMKHMGYDKNLISCAKCGVIIKNNKAGTKMYCEECSTYTPQRFKTITCVDCGKEFEIDSLSRRIRCDSCYNEERKRINRENQRKWKETNNTSSF